MSVDEAAARAAEALAVSDRLANSDCHHNTPDSVRESAADCALCRALALDAFAQERVDIYSQESGKLWRDQIEREKREAVEAVLRAAAGDYATDEEMTASIAMLCDHLDRIAGREVGTTLKRVRGTDA